MKWLIHHGEGSFGSSFGSETFRGVLYVSQLGRELVVYTDHNPLSFLAKFKTSNSRVFRWALVLQPYSLAIQHVAGKDNILADALSHMPVGEPP